jgi:hypothetical protein
MSKNDFLIWGNNQPDNFTKNIREVIKFHEMYGKKENSGELLCISCGATIVHNYGTDEYPQCIICGNENADDYFPL